MSENSFFIYFNFPLENTGKLICIEAIVEPAQSTLHYNIHSFRNFDGIKKEAVSKAAILPDIKIKKHQATTRWVHTDSEQSSLLSNLVGNAIDQRNLLQAC